MRYDHYYIKLKYESPEGFNYTLFQVHTINMSVAVWVGFLALFGIATDDGVVMGIYHLSPRPPPPCSIVGDKSVRGSVIEYYNRLSRSIKRN